MDLVEARSSGGGEIDKATDRSCGKRRTYEPTGDGEDRALGEELADEASVVGTERRTHRELAPAREAAHDEQIRNIEARDEEEQAGGGGKREQRGPNVADDILRQRARHAAYVPGRRLRACEEARQLLARVGDRRAGPESTDRVQLRVDWVIPQRTGARNNRRPEVHTLRVVKSERHHADDGVRRTTPVQDELATDHARVSAEESLPASVAEHRDWRGAAHVVFGTQRAAEQRPSSEKIEVPAGDERAAEPNDIVAETNWHRLRAAEGEELHTLERLRPPSVLSGVVVQERKVIRAAVARDAPEHDQSILRAHRQWLEDQVLGDREHCRREPNAEGECEHDTNYPTAGAP